jgi:hypothetical protein
MINSQAWRRIASGNKEGVQQPKKSFKVKPPKRLKNKY